MILENYCILGGHRLFGQTTKQPLNNCEPQKPWKYEQFWGLRPDPSSLEKNKCKKDKSWTTSGICYEFKNVACKDRASRNGMQ